jgi:hypothetical protein
MRTVRVTAIAFGFSALLLAGGAAADEYDPAEVSFERGVELMEAGRFAQACPLIEESYRVDPRPGTLFTLAECEAKRGRLATAVARYDEYLKMYEGLPQAKKAAQRERERESRAQKAELEMQIPKLVLILPEGAPPGTVVKRDGAVVAVSALGAALEVDPGEHVVTTQAPGGPVTEERVTVKRTERKEVRLKVVMGGPVKPKPLALRQGEPARPWQRPVAIASISVGGGAIAIGAVLAVLAEKKRDESEVSCGAGSRPGSCSDSRELVAESKSLAIGTLAAFMVGGVLFMGGAVLVITEPSTPSAPSTPSTPNTPSAPSEPNAEEKPSIRDDPYGGARRPAWQARVELVPGGLQIKGAW